MPALFDRTYPTQGDEINDRLGKLLQIFNTGAIPATSGGGIPITPPAAGFPVQDAGPAWTSAHGIAGVPLTSSDATEVTLATSLPANGFSLVITDLIISVATAMTVTLKEESSGTVLWGPHFLAANTIVQNTTRSRFFKLPTVNKRLCVLASVPGNITVDAFYFSESP